MDVLPEPLPTHTTRGAHSSVLCDRCVLWTQLIIDHGKGPITVALYHVISCVESQLITCKQSCRCCKENLDLWGSLTSSLPVRLRQWAAARAALPRMRDFTAALPRRRCFRVQKSYRRVA